MTPRNALPQGWVRTQLGAVVCDVQPGFACGVNNRGGDGVAHLRPMNVTKDGEIDLSDLKFISAKEADGDRKSLRRDDVLFNNTNSTELVGKTAVYEYDEQRAFSNHMTRVRVREGALDPKYCAKYLHNCWREGYFQQVCNQHVSQSSISRATLLATPIDLPPLAEQKRIMAKVEALLERVNKARGRLDRVPDILKRFRQSVLAAACSGRLTADWRAANPKQEAPDSLFATIAREAAQLTKAKKISRKAKSLAPMLEDELPFDLPDSWKWIQAQDVCAPTGTITYGILKPVWVNAGVPTIRVRDIQNGQVVVSDVGQCCPERAAKFSKTSLKQGDLLIAKDGATLGKTAFVPKSLDGGNVTQHVLRFPISQHVSRHFVRCAIDSPEGQAWMSGETKGVALPGVNVEDFRRMPIPLPPFAEQEEIVRRVVALFDLADRVLQHLLLATIQTKHIAHSVIAKAFAGELVETEADLARREGRDYEPASVLLERIAAECSAATTTRKQKRTGKN